MKAMETIKMSLCPACQACPEVVIDVDEIRIGEEDNMVRLSPAEWASLYSYPQADRATSWGRRGRNTALEFLATSSQTRDASAGSGRGCQRAVFADREQPAMTAAEPLSDRSRHRQAEAESGRT